MNNRFYTIIGKDYNWHTIFSMNIVNRQVAQNILVDLGKCVDIQEAILIDGVSGEIITERIHE